MDKLNQNTNDRKKYFTKHQKGSSLIEVLVTFFVLAVGLLGLASLQMISLKNINNSQFRSLATNYAYDMAERMRSNRAGVSHGDYDAINATESDPSCTSCSSAQIAQMDAYQWNQLISQAANAGGLPQGKGTVTKNGSLFEIKIAWQEQGRDSSGGKVESADFTLNIQI